ncbi:MAG: hypothetical protein ABI607_03535 [Betaproteobacteria bacterium]
MVGTPPQLKRLAAGVAFAAAFFFSDSFAAGESPSPGAKPSYVVTGQCRDGRPHGAYELHMPDGQLRVAGAFNQGKRIGTFLFWSTAGVRIALLPYDDDSLSGTVALWYSTGTARSVPKPKLEAVYANGQLFGAVRSWYPDGRPRAEYRYAKGALADARAWDAKGAALATAQARTLALRDATEDRQFYNALEGIVRDNPPQCTAERTKA